MARRQRQFAQARDNAMSSKAPSIVSQPTSVKSIVSANSNKISTHNRQFKNEAQNSRMQRQVQSRVQTEQSRLIKPVTNAPQSPSKKLKDVCVNCVNKLMANKNKMKELEKKEKQREIQKKKLEIEREMILQEQMDHLRRVREEQQKIDAVAEQKRRLKEQETKKKAREADRIRQQMAQNANDDKTMEVEERKRREVYYRELEGQIEEERKRRKNQKDEIRNYKPPTIDDQALYEQQMLRSKLYREELKTQMEEKAIRTKMEKERQKQQQKKIIEDLTKQPYEPNITVQQADQLLGVKRQIEQRAEQRRKEELQKKQQFERDRELLKEQKEQENRYIAQKMYQMNSYVNELSSQVQEKKVREAKELEQRRAPAYQYIQQSYKPEFKNCTNCDLKFPKNYLSTVDI